MKLETYRMYLNSISNANKDIEDRGLSEKSPTFVIGLRQLSPKHMRKRRSGMLIL